MRWYSIDESYITHLRRIESRVPFIDYGSDKFKPFFGKLFEIGDLVYVTQVSSPKGRHYKMTENIDFYKLYRGKKLLSVVNLNYMFPVPKAFLKEVNYGELDNLLVFDSKESKAFYIGLLKSELREIKKKEINLRAEELYAFRYVHPEDKVSKRCFDFKALEVKALEYEPKQ